ncbi:hypothetical protein LTR62_007520 [Meristemomyces frigidus]|uniref:Uncharacterized protein n=1 Tax=Meristemomyces frigidus TaxID=1508187 RepID=A0AAN7TM82_9PEZI|nr:hypothetical protein LTR62_007520 [Meristemomyces frigidus]
MSLNLLLGDKEQTSATAARTLIATRLETLTLQLGHSIAHNTLPSSISFIQDHSATFLQTYSSNPDALVPNSTNMTVSEFLTHLHGYSAKFPAWDVTIYPPHADVEASCRKAVVWVTIKANEPGEQREATMHEAVYKVYWRRREDQGEEEWEWYRHVQINGAAGYLFGP